MGKQSRRERREAKPKKARITYVDRPFEGLPFEAQLVAMREILPSATMTVKTTEEHGGADVVIAALLPGMAAAQRREDGVAMVGAQTVQNSGDVSLDIAARILAAIELEDGETLLQSPEPEADGPRLQDILDLNVESEMELHDNFGYWVGANDAEDPEIQAAIEQSKDQMIPTKEVEGFPGAYWCRMQREFLRWVRPEPEDAVLDGLARLQNARKFSFEGGRFVGAFRALGLLIPVFELDRGTDADELVKPLKDFEPVLEAAIANTDPLTPEERRARQGVISRQVTLR